MPKDSLQTSLQETLPPRLEILNEKHIAYLGSLAIGPENLGINDPLTHLHQYLESGDSALVGIKEDVETDIAERLPKIPFVNYVGFEFTGQDFVSLKDKVSMNSITKTNLQIFEIETAKNQKLCKELIRAKTEVQETQKLVTWFKNAPIGGYLIFESLPIGKQKFAISRIYQKINDNLLEGCFVSMYSSSLGQFNKLREELSIGMADCKTEQEILNKCYEFYTPDLTEPDKFIDYYVDIYDCILQKQNNKKYSFGLEIGEPQEVKNGLHAVRDQPSLTSIYLDTIKAMANSQGMITVELIQICKKLGIGYNLKETQAITPEIARKLLGEVVLGITSAIDKADTMLLQDLNNVDYGQDASYAAASYFGELAKNAGESYASNGCPEYATSNLSLDASGKGHEYSSLSRAFGTELTPDNFGKPKIGVCRIINCPSRGNISWWPDKTLVGGCDICVSCHKIFEKGKSPELLYKVNEQELKKKQPN